MSEDLFAAVAKGWGVIFNATITRRQVELAMNWLEMVQEVTPSPAPIDTAEMAHIDASLPPYMTFPQCEGCRWPVDCRTKGVCRNFAAVEACHAAE